MSLRSHSGGIVRSGLGALVLQSEVGVHLATGLVSRTEGQSITVHTDRAAKGTGIFTLDSGKVFHTANGTFTITASEIDLSGALNAGSASVFLHTSTSVASIGLGSSFGDMIISTAEMQRVTAAGLTVGNSANGSIEVSGLNAVHTATVSGVVTLMAINDFAQVNFKKAAFFFNCWLAMANNVTIFNTT